jgi:uncharacterized UBP type Zn finger protein
MGKKANLATRIDTLIRRLLWTGRLRAGVCTHRHLIRDVRPGTDGCEACLALGDRWVHLRLCLICGHVGCCNNSKNKHASKHFHDTNHPLVRSLEPGEDWLWCYIDERVLSP